MPARSSLFATALHVDDLLTGLLPAPRAGNHAMPPAPTTEVPVERGTSVGFVLLMRDGESVAPVVVSDEATRAFEPGAIDLRQSLSPIAAP